MKNIDVKTMIFIEELNSKDVFCGSIKPIHASLSEPLSESKSVLVKIHSAWLSIKPREYVGWLDILKLIIQKI